MTTPQAQYELPAGTGNNPQEDYNENFEKADHAGGWMTVEIALGQGGIEGEWYTFDVTGKAKKAQADSITNCLLVFILTEDTAEGLEGKFLKAGNWVKSGWGGDPSKEYYLSQSVAGAWTTVEPLTGIKIFLGKFDQDTETFHIAEGGGSGGGGTGGDHALLSNLALHSSGHILTNQWDIVPPANQNWMISLYDNAYSTDESFTGWNTQIVKVGGASTNTDDFYGHRSYWDYDDSVNGWGSATGFWCDQRVSSGATMSGWLVGNANLSRVLAGGTVENYVLGTYNFVSTENTGETDDMVAGTRNFLSLAGQGVGGSGSVARGTYTLMTVESTGFYWDIAGEYTIMQIYGSSGTNVYGDYHDVFVYSGGIVDDLYGDKVRISVPTGATAVDVFGAHYDMLDNAGVAGTTYAVYVTDSDWDYGLYIDGQIPIYHGGMILTPSATYDYTEITGKGLFIYEQGLYVGNSNISGVVAYPNRLVDVFYSGSISDGGGSVWREKHYTNCSGGTHGATSGTLIGLSHEHRWADTGATGANAFKSITGMEFKPVVENCEIVSTNNFTGFHVRPQFSNAELLGGDMTGVLLETVTYNETINGDLYGTRVLGGRYSLGGSVTGTSYLFYIDQETGGSYLDWDYALYVACDIPSYIEGDLEIKGVTTLTGGISGNLVLQGTISASQATAGTTSEAFGSLATATGDRATAVGEQSQGSGDDSVAIGQGADAGLQSIAIGSSALATAVQDNILIGYGTVSVANNSIVIGSGSASGATDTIIIGDGNSTSDISTIMIGNNQTYTRRHGVLIGHGNSGTGNRTVAIGYGVTCGGDNSIAIGASSSATGGAGSIAIGYQASNSTGYGIVLGRGATNTTANQMVVGATTYEIDYLQFIVSGTYLTWTNSVRVVGNLSCRPAGTGASSEVFGSGSSCTGDGGVVVGSDIVTTADQPTFVGHDVTGGGKSVSMGFEANAGVQGVGIGYQVDGGNNSVYIGYQAINSSGGGWNAVVIGHSAQAINGGQNTIIGYGASQNGARGVIIGQGASSSYDDCIVLGKSATGTQDHEMVVGATSYEIDHLKFIVSGTYLTFNNLLYVTDGIYLGDEKPLYFDGVTGDYKIVKETTGPLVELNHYHAGNLAFALTSDLGHLGNKVLFTYDIEVSNLIQTYGVYRGLARKTANYTLTDADHVVFFNSTTLTLVATLPAGGTSGKEFRIVNTGTQNLTITPNGTDKLLGVNASYTLAPGNALIIHWEGTDGWY